VALSPALSLRVKNGEIVAPFGADGLEKTTTLRMISGLVRCRRDRSFSM